MMKTLLPAPLLSVALFLLWLLLNRSFSSGQILLGALLGLLLPLLLRGLRPLPVRVRHPLTILRLALRVVWDTSLSNFNVVRFMLFPGMRKHPGQLRAHPAGTARPQRPGRARHDRVHHARHGLGRDLARPLAAHASCAGGR